MAYYFDRETRTTQQSTWPPASDRTTRRTARPWSTSRSIWSSTPATSTCPWLTTSTEMTSLIRASPPSSRRTPTRRGTTARSSSTIRTGEEGRLSSRTSPSQPPWSGALLWRLWRLLLSWRRPSTKVFSTCTRQLTATPIFAISLRRTSWTSRWTPSRRSPPDRQGHQWLERKAGLTVPHCKHWLSILIGFKTETFSKLKYTTFWPQKK